MIQYNNFLMKREQSQARLSFAKREKSRLLAKTILTLVALIAVTTGAWADETPLVTIESKDYKTFKSGSMTFDDKVTVTFSSSVDNDGDETGWYSYSARTLTVTAAEGYTITSCKFYTYEGPAANGYTVEGESPSVSLSAWQVLTDDKSVTIGEPGVTKIEVYGAAAPSGPEVELKLGAKIKNGDVLTFGDTRVHFTTPCSLPYIIFSAVNTSTTARISYNDNVYSITFSPLVDATDIEYPDVTQQGVGAALGLKTGQTQPEYVMVTEGTGTFADPFILTPYATYNCGGSPVDGKAICDASDPSAIKVDWNKTAKTGSFTMPGGNVTLEPEYYPQATAAEGAVTAADADARATTDDPLVKVDATKLTGAKKLMYFVSNSGTTAPAYDAEGWTDQLPTAEGFTQQGIVYVWYYPVGIDEGVDEATATYSDGDICLQSITARIAAAPTYAVTFAEGTAEPDKWTASPATDVTKGQTVTVTYTGTKKVIGVKAEKKAAAPAETTVTLTPGQIGFLSSDGSSNTINGITIAVSGDAHFNENGLMDVTAFDVETGEPCPGAGTFTFTSSVGKIKRIDINHESGNWWGSGDGWPGSYEVYDTSTFTWSGTPAASVTLNGSCNDMDFCVLYSVSSFVFTIEPTN